MQPSKTREKLLQGLAQDHDRGLTGEVCTSFRSLGET